MIPCLYSHLQISTLYIEETPYLDCKFSYPKTWGTFALILPVLPPVNLAVPFQTVRK